MVPPFVRDLLMARNYHIAVGSRRQVADHGRLDVDSLSHAFILRNKREKQVQRLVGNAVFPRDYSPNSSASARMPLAAHAAMVGNRTVHGHGGRSGGLRVQVR